MNESRVKVQEHNLELLRNVFDVAYNAIVEAHGTLGSIPIDIYIEADDVMQAASDGAQRAIRDLIDAARRNDLVPKRKI